MRGLFCFYRSKIKVDQKGGIVARPEITSIYPTDGFTSFPIGNEIIILFSREVDLDSLKNRIFLYGPDFDRIGGPYDITRYSSSYTNTRGFEDVLKSGGYQGEVDIEIYLYKTDNTGQPLEDQSTHVKEDEAYSKVVIRPVNLLQEKTEYTLYLAGEGSELNKDAVSSLSVLTPLPNVTNTGTGRIESLGTFSEIEADTLTVRCIASGDAGEAVFSYEFDSGSSGTFQGSHEPIYIEYGVWLNLFGDSDLSFAENDSWTVNLEPAEFLENHYRISFSTIYPAYSGLPESVSSSPLIDSETYTEFELLTTDPENMESNVSLYQDRIVLEFNKEIDETKITDKTFKLFASSLVDGSTVEVPFSYIVNKRIVTLFIEEE